MTESIPTPPTFLKTVLRHLITSPPVLRPHVTLTFAQSLDAKIAGAQGRQLILSGKESMVMTHWMRTMHDAILVGINTAINDDPQLNVRHLPPSASPYNLPRPVILDTNLHLSVSCRLLRNFQGGVGRQPWICCSANLSPEFLERKKALETAGARVIEITSAKNEKSKLSLLSLLQILQELGVKSLMVEGGARIISSFLAEPIVDALLITVAPVLVGEVGVGYCHPPVLVEDSNSSPRLRPVHTEVLGQDTMFALVRNF